MQIHTSSVREGTTSATWSYRQPDLDEKDDQINYEADCKTALATPDLLKILYLSPLSPPLSKSFLAELQA